VIGIDTNVLVRHIVWDDPGQSSLASEFIERRLGPDEPGFVSAVVMVELAWVLQRRYGLSSSRLAEVLERVVQIDALAIEHEAEVFEAIAMLAAGRGSFADALIAALAREAGCAITVTFDKRARRLPGLVPIEQALRG
jgi:predicted nucleic-acid-binding protein